jgi:N-carbamoylputrescine amidase
MPNIEANLTIISEMAHQAADGGADLVLFPEAALTGLINNDNPACDLPLGQIIPGPITEMLSSLTRKRGIWFAVGLLERDGKELYDSAILIDPKGEIKLKYRRIQPQWHGRKADPDVYCQGKEVKKINTPLGAFTFLICGDLFEDNLAAQVRKLQSDWLLFPFARCFDDGTYDQARWNEAKSEYLERIKLVRTTTFMVNYLADKELRMSR